MLSFSKEEEFESAWKIVDVWTASILAFSKERREHMTHTTEPWQL